MKLTGLGDFIEKITIATGIKRIATNTASLLKQKNCGCEKRKQALNKAFPFKK